MKLHTAALGMVVVGVIIVGLVTPSAMDGFLHAQGADKGKDKPAEAKALTYKEAQDDVLVTKLAFGDQKFVSKTIEMSLKSKVVEEVQGGLMLSARLGHLEHGKLIVKLMESENELTTALASLSLLRSPDGKFLGDLFKRWDKLEADGSEKLTGFRHNLRSLAITLDMLKLMQARAKQDKTPAQAECALDHLRRFLGLGKEATLQEVDKKLRDPEFLKSLKLCSQVHTPQSSTKTLFYPTWDYKAVRPVFGRNTLIEAGSPRFDALTSHIPRGEKQGFEVRIKVLIEGDNDEVQVGMVPEGKNTGAVTNIQSNKHVSATLETPLQAKGKWIEVRFAWMPWARADGTQGMCTVDSGALQPGITHFKFDSIPPRFSIFVDSGKGRAFVSPGEISLIDRLP